MKNIVLIFGKICSGKDYVSQSFVENGYESITISTIIRKITKLEKRSDLLITDKIKDKICQELDEFINENNNVVINGIRQIEILEHILKNHRVTSMLWVYSDKETRRKRFEMRKSKKDDIDFDTAEKRDDEMGLKNIYQKYINKMKIIKN